VDNDSTYISTLDVVWTTRQGGGGRTERRFLDFVIDGVTLSSQLNTDYISPFGCLDAGEQEVSIDRLLGKSPPDMAHDRTALYICPECGDLGCGAVTLLVQREDGVIIWKDFGMQYNYEDVIHTEGFENIGPFTFDITQYSELFEHLRELSKS
jgi:hypothetical protein